MRTGPLVVATICLAGACILMVLHLRQAAGAKASVGAQAATEWTSTSSMSTTVHCLQDGNEWNEYGWTCHSNPLERASLNAAPIAIRSDWYTFEPRTDVTAPELALALKAIMPALACGNRIVCGDAREAIDDLPPDVKRHFEHHGASER